MRLLPALALVVPLLPIGACFARDNNCRPIEGGSALSGLIDGEDMKREKTAARLLPVAKGCGDVVDIQFVPGSSDKAVVLDQKGTAWWLDFKAGTSGKWLEIEPTEGWEQGLLGLAFHPKFAENGRVIFNWTATGANGLFSTVASHKVDPSKPFAAAPKQEHVIYTVSQPYSNHNAGGLAFGPDGMLYIGWGDGGKANDPHGNGQNRGTALGAMLRLNVDGAAPYTVPPDNPWVGVDGVLPEIWAIGLRNPWRYSFDPKGRMVVADVGQNKWEEVTFLTKGGNGGWNTLEGSHCFQPDTDCKTEGLIQPIWEYGHHEGQSITGGYVASEPASLAGRYVFGDFGSGRIWSLALPEVGKTAAASAVGRFNVQLSTFGVDAKGRVYTAGWTNGTIYRLVDG